MTIAILAICVVVGWFVSKPVLVAYNAWLSAQAKELAKAKRVVRK